MKIAEDTPISELYHAANIRYIDLDPDEVCHWKYIKREKLPNGKWRYYYDQSELDAVKAKYESAQKAAQKATVEANQAQADAEAAYAHLQRANAARNGVNSLSELLRVDKEYKNASTNYKDAQATQRDAERRLRKANTEYKKLANKYNTMKVVSFPARVISKGLAAVANVLSGLFDKKK